MISLSATRSNRVVHFKPRGSSRGAYYISIDQKGDSANNNNVTTASKRFNNFFATVHFRLWPF